MVVNYHIKKRNYLFRTFVQLPVSQLSISPEAATI